MIRFTKDGKVDRRTFTGQAAPNRTELYDALDIAVASLRRITNAPGTQGFAMQTASEALRQIGADHAEG